jgi:hypothetical protein
MKKNKLIYWITTSIISLMMLFSAFNYLTNDTMKNAFIHLGYPSYFRVELAIAKVFGAMALLLPISGRLKEIPYIGFAITFVSAFIAHLSSGDPVAVAVMPLVALGLLTVSYIYFRRLGELKNAKA